MLPTDVVVYDMKDNTQPTLVAAKVTSDKVVELTFDETIDFTNSDLTNATRNFFVVINGVKFSVDDVAQKGSLTKVLNITTVDTFDYSKGVKVEIVNDASGDMFIIDNAGNKAAEKVITATIDIQE